MPQSEGRAAYAAAEWGAGVTYHGSITDAHGPAIVDDYCRCEKCDRYPDRYELLLPSGRVLKHVRQESFTKA